MLINTGDYRSIFSGLQHVNDQVVTH